MKKPRELILSRAVGAMAVPKQRYVDPERPYVNMQFVIGADI